MLGRDRGRGVVCFPSPCARQSRCPAYRDGPGVGLGAPPTGGMGGIPPSPALPKQKRMLRPPSPYLKGTLPKIPQTEKGPAPKFLSRKSASLDAGLSGGQLTHLMPGNFPGQKRCLGTRPHQAADRVRRTRDRWPKCHHVLIRAGAGRLASGRRRAPRLPSELADRKWRALWRTTTNWP